MEKKQAWRVSALVDIGYVVGDTGRQHVANHFQMDRKIVLNASLGTAVSPEVIEAAKRAIQNRSFDSLSNSDENYGVVGLKRWDPRVLTISCVAVFKDAGEEE